MFASLVDWFLGFGFLGVGFLCFDFARPCGRVRQWVRVSA